jgi:predicted SprT family Zn-dependent metalloprotease
MKLEDAEYLAMCLMEDHHLSGWTFGFDNAKARCGACFHKRRKITLSRHYVRMNAESEVRDTILHEIAHALAGREAGHGLRWKSWAAAIGATPERCRSNAAMPEGGVEGVCDPGCSARHTRHRMPPKHLVDRYTCNRCRTQVTWVRLQ